MKTVNNHKVKAVQRDVDAKARLVKTILQ